MCIRDRKSTKTSRGVVEKWGEFKLEKIKIPRGQLAESCVCVICKATKENNVGTRNNKSELNKKQIKVEEKEVKGDEEKESEKKSCPDCFQEKIGPGISHKCTEANSRYCDERERKGTDCDESSQVSG